MKKKFRSLELTAKTLVSSFGSGSHASLLKDSKIDVDVPREYQPGDKRLDSKSSLRMQQTMSRVFTPDKSVTVFIVLDVSCSIYSKLEQAVTTCLYLCYLANLTNDQVGLITFSDSVKDLVLPSYDGRNVSSVLERIYEKDTLSGSTDLEFALQKLGHLELNNTLFFLISDFCFDFSDKSVQFARRINSGVGNKMAGLILLNRQEWALGGRSFVVDFVDAESGNSTCWDFSSSRSNERHQENFKNWFTTVKIKLRQTKAEPVIIPVDQKEFLAPLVKYFVRT